MYKTKKMLIISFDAVGSEDFSTLLKLPHFKKICNRSLFCQNVESVYPSLTYPAHTSIVTGKVPARHGVVNNTLIQPGRQSPDWYWQRSYIKGTTLYDEAIKKGMSVAALLWPVTAKSDITYNLPEIFANRPWTNQILTSMANGTISYQFKLNQLFGHLRDGKNQPMLDDFTHESLKYTLKTYRPDLTFVHYTDVDTHRHLYGVRSKEAFDALRRHDERLGELLTVMKYCDMDLNKDTTLVVLGDHYQKDVKKVILLNKIFETYGYLEACGTKISKWKVLCKNCDGSAYIYIHPSVKDKEERHRLKKEVFELLSHLKEDPANGIAAVYSGQSAKKLGADPTCTWMLEARSGYYFQDALDEADIAEIEKATHGYRPDRRGYQTFFMMAGPDIKEKKEIEKMTLMDEGPTMAHLLGLTLPDTDGHILEEIL